MIDTLPNDVQETIWTAYLHGVQERMQRSLMYHMRLFCQDEASFNTLLDWMSHMLQHPYTKPDKTIVLVGPKATGKTLFIELLANLLGRGRVMRTNTLRRLQHRNGDLEDTMVVCLDDCRLRAELPSIESLVSATHVRITHPDQPSHMVSSYHRVLVTALPWTMGWTLTLPPEQSAAFHQRFTVISCGTERATDFYDAIDDSAQVDQLRRHLMGRPLDLVTENGD